MHPIAALVLQAYVSQSQEKNALKALLPEAIEINSNLKIEDIKKNFFDLSEVHFSWYLSYLRELSDKEQAFFLGCFDASNQNNLKSLLRLDLDVVQLIGFEKQCASYQLKKRADVMPAVPKESLKESTLYPLLELSKNSIYRCIDALGVFDLSLVLKQVVDKKILTEIASCLTKEQLQFLQQINKQPTKVVAEKMNISQPYLEPKKMQRQIHKMGLYRLALALSSESKDFNWFFSHQIDTGRAKVLEKIQENRTDEDQTIFLKKQVLQVLKRLNL